MSFILIILVINVYTIIALHLEPPLEPITLAAAEKLRNPP
jgi:hypothetical protein